MIESFGDKDTARILLGNVSDVFKRKSLLAPIENCSKFTRLPT